MPLCIYSPLQNPQSTSMARCTNAHLHPGGGVRPDIDRCITSISVVCVLKVSFDILWCMEWIVLNIFVRYDSTDYKCTLPSLDVGTIICMVLWVHVSLRRNVLLFMYSLWTGIAVLLVVCSEFQVSIEVHIMSLVSVMSILCHTCDGLYVSVQIVERQT